MKSLSVFRPRIATRVTGCSDMLIDQAVLDTCIDFCDRSGVVRRMIDSFVTTASVLEYDVPGGTQQNVAVIMRLWADSNELTPLDEDAIPTPFGFISSVLGVVNTPSAPRFFTETQPGSVGLYPMPDKAYTINARVSMKPSRAATQVEDQLFEDWVDAITDGALARLYVMPLEFHNAALANFHSKQYEIGVNAALAEARKGAARAQSRVIPVHI